MDSVLLVRLYWKIVPPPPSLVPPPWTVCARRERLLEMIREPYSSWQIWMHARK